MKKTLAALAIALPFGLAHAQSHTAEAAPQLNARPQVAAEAKKAARPSGVAPIKDGSTAQGQGSGIDTVTRSEQVAVQRQAQREARPHRETTQGATPK
ncbi:MAG: hypothetical protein JSS14_19370 [Proteobacteria bacterium]|nr:hypothetical protein [Pseudomonadota bacterium]